MDDQQASAADGTARPAPAVRADQTTPENPWPLARLSANLRAYIARCAPTWVEGQVVEVNRRSRVTYLTLRDVAEEVSVPVTLFAQETARLERPLEQGTRVVVQLKPDFWAKGGKLSMLGSGIRPVGLGDLLERLERLRRALAEEGLFDASLKKPLPLLPRSVGLITGRNSDAEKDVIRNATLRWPAVHFTVRQVPVQGPSAAPAVIEALAELDADPQVDVVVIARGGGAFEDLLPFSEESLLRAVHAARTPVVSAIGHENDQPLLDWVADLRASTPTDAGKRVVPDVAEEKVRIAQARLALDRSLETFLHLQEQGLASVRSRQVFTRPETMVLQREEEVDRLRTRARTTLEARALRAKDEVHHLRARVLALSPQKTLDRGYAVVQDGQGRVLTDAAAVPEGTAVRMRLAHGTLDATTTGSVPGSPAGAAPTDHDPTVPEEDPR